MSDARPALAALPALPSSPDRRAPAEPGAALALLAGAVLRDGGGAATYASLKRGLVGAVQRDPFDAAVATVLGGALLFYLAEKGKNPKVTSYGDGLVFISTCLSVGYADVFARTPAGKAIAAAVMTIGPALSGALFDRGEGGGDAGERETGHAGDAARTPPSPETMAIQRAILGKLDAILVELRAGRITKG